MIAADVAAAMPKSISQRLRISSSLLRGDAERPVTTIIRNRVEGAQVPCCGCGTGELELDWISDYTLAPRLMVNSSPTLPRTRPKCAEKKKWDE